MCTLKIFVFSTLFINSLFAQVQIDDFMWSLESLDREFESTTFEEAFKCADTAKFQAAKDMCEFSCEPFGNFGSMCQSFCIPPDLNSQMVDQEIRLCTNDSVTIYSSDGDIRTVTRDQFKSLKKNPVRELIQQLPTWIPGAYAITLYQKTRGKHTLGWKGPMQRQVDAWNLMGTISIKVGDSETTEQIIITLIDDEDVPWFAKASRFRFTLDGTLWRLHDL